MNANREDVQALYGDGITYGDVLSRAAEALYDAEVGPYAEAIGESWGTQKQELWEATADAVLRRIGVTCLFCPAFDGSFHGGWPECAGCQPDGHVGSRDGS